MRGWGVGGMAAVALAAAALAASGIATASGLPEASGGSPRPGSWRKLGHDNASSFHNPRSSITPKRAAELEPAWELDAPGPVNGAPAVAGDRAYLLSGAGLLALDAETGNEVWRRDDIAGTSSPTLHRGTLYLLTADAELWAVDADDGVDRWHVVADDQEFASGFSSPVVAGKAVIVGLASVEEIAAEANATYRGASSPSTAAPARSCGGTAPPSRPTTA